MHTHLSVFARKLFGYAVVLFLCSLCPLHAFATEAPTAWAYGYDQHFQDQYVWYTSYLDAEVLGYSGDALAQRGLEYQAQAQTDADMVFTTDMSDIPEHAAFGYSQGDTFYWYSSADYAQFYTQSYAVNRYDHSISTATATYYPIGYVPQIPPSDPPTPVPVEDDISPLVYVAVGTGAVVLGAAGVYLLAVPSAATRLQDALLTFYRRLIPAV